MDGYGYPYPAAYPPVANQGEFPDHGDGFGEYYAMQPMNEDPAKRSTYYGVWPPDGFEESGEPWKFYPYYYQWKPPTPENIDRPSCSKYRGRKRSKRTRSPDCATKTTRSKSRSRSRSRSRSKSRSRTRSRSKSRSQSRSRSQSGSRHHELTYKEPTLLDAFRVMYLTPSSHNKSTTKYLTTKKKQDRIQEMLKSDGLGSKRWLFYPRKEVKSEPVTGEVPGVRDNCDQRIKVDGDFFRKFKKRKNVGKDAPASKLKRWELILYKKLGFIQAV